MYGGESLVTIDVTFQSPFDTCHHIFVMSSHWVVSLYYPIKDYDGFGDGVHRSTALV